MVQAGPQPDPRRMRLTALRITVIYLSFAIAYILGSDWIVEQITDDVRIMARLQSAKGVSFMLVTGVLLWRLIASSHAQIRRSYEQADTLRAIYQNIAANLPGAMFRYRRHADGSRSGDFVTEGIQRIAGLSPETVAADPDAFLRRIHPDDLEPMLEAGKAARAVTSRFDHEYRVRGPDGQYRWVRAVATPIAQPNGDLIWHGVLLDVDEQHRAREAQEASEMRFRLMADAAPVMIWMADKDGKCTYFNERWLRFTGRTLEQEVALGWYPGIHPEDRERARKVYESAITERKAFRMEYRLLSGSGEYFWVLDTGVPICGAQGEFAGFIGSAVDISELKRSGEALRRSAEVQRVLLRELDHRVKNSLGGLLSLIDMCADRETSVEQFARAIRRRVQAMADVHGMLSSNRWASLDVAAMIRQMIPPLCPGAVELEGPETHVPASQATALGMTIHELMWNSIKHGALGQAEGRVAIRWVPIRDAADGCGITLHWRESGGPEITTTPEPGLGTKLIQGFVRHELRGSAELTYPRSGARHTLHIFFDAPPSTGDAREGDPPPARRAAVPAQALG